MERERINRIALTGLLGALALVLSYIETMIPLPLAVPGIKLGLANAAVLVALFAVDTKSGVQVCIVKILAAGFLFGSPTMLAYSCGGSILALLAMIAMKHIPHIDALPISMVAAVLHNVGQLIVAALMLGSWAVMATLPVLAFAACITGFLVGVVVQGVVGALILPSSARPQVDLSSLELKPGEHVVFTGPNGSGKTSAALQLAGLADAPARDGLLVFQDPDNQIVYPKVDDDIAFGLENNQTAPDEMPEAIKQSLQTLDIEYLFSSQIEQLSGGQKQLVAVAGVLAMSPALVILDEADSMLDAAAKAKLACTVRALCEQGITVVSITHQLDEIACDRVVQFKNGKITHIGTPADCQLVSPEHDAVKRLEPISAQAPHLQADGIAFAYGERTIFQDIHIDVSPGDCLGISGPCGSGKSTLLKCLAGHLQPSAGAVTVNGAALTQEQFRETVALIGQRPEEALFAATAFEDVLFGALNKGLSQEQAQQAAAEALLKVGLDPEIAKEKSPFAYSGGEQRRLAVAGMLVLDAPFILMDEPTAGLDPDSALLVEQLICDLRAQGKGVVIVSHDQNVLENLCTATLKLESAKHSSTHETATPQKSGFGTFSPIVTPMHKVNPCVKITLCTAIMVAGFLAQSWLGIAVVALASILCMIAAKMRPTDALSAVKPFAFLMVFIAVFDILFVGGQSAVFQLGPLSIGLEGLLFAVESLARFLIVLMGTSVLMRTTSPTALSDACVKMMKPLGKIGLDANSLGLSLGLTFRYLPLVVQQFWQVKAAQQARLAKFDSGSISKRLKTYIPVFVPMFFGCISSAKVLAMAIENRGYHPKARRTSYRAYPFAACDVLTLIACICLVVLAILLP